LICCPLECFIMRTYHFLSSDHAVDDISKRHLKLSEIHKLNDPFELWCTAQGDKKLRRDLRKWKSEMAEKYGMLCFCLHWHNPVLWSHYANRHRGICLGFDVPDNSVKAVQYVASRTPLRFPLTEAAIQSCSLRSNGIGIMKRSGGVGSGSTPATRLQVYSSTISTRRSNCER